MYKANAGIIFHCLKLVILQIQEIGTADVRTIKTINGSQAFRALY